MVKLLRHILIILFSLLLCDFIVGIIGDIIIQKCSKKPYNGDAAMVNYSLNKSTSDVLIVGSSSAMCHYIPKMFKDSLSKFYKKDLQVFNAGASTQGLAYDYSLIKSVVERKIPKVIVLDLHYDDFFREMSKEQQSRIQAYYKFNAHVTNVLNQNLPVREKLFLRSNMYRLNSTITKLAISFFKSLNESGYYFHDGSLLSMPESICEDSYHVVNQNAVAEFEAIVNICNENDIKLFICASPMLNHKYKDINVRQEFHKICNEYETVVFDYKDNVEFQDFRLYYDQYHLNVEGAKRFTALVCTDMINYLNSL